LILIYKDICPSEEKARGYGLGPFSLPKNFSFIGIKVCPLPLMEAPLLYFTSFSFTSFLIIATCKIKYKFLF